MSGIFLFFKQKTAYEMRISDWSSDVCSSDLFREFGLAGSFVRHCQQFYHLPTSDPFRQCGDEPVEGLTIRLPWEELVTIEIGRASCRARVCQYVLYSVVAVSLKNTLLLSSSFFV